MPMKRGVSVAILSTAWLGGCGNGVFSQAATPARNDVSKLTLDAGIASQRHGTEQIRANAELMGLNAGSLEWVSAGPCPSAGRKLGTVRSSLQTAGVIRWFKRSDGTASTVVDPETSLPIEQEMRVDDSGDHKRYHLNFARGQFRYLYEREGQDPQSATKPVPEGDHAYDVQSAFLLLRAWRPQPKQRGYFHIVLGRTLWRAEVVFVGSDVLDYAEDKKRRALRIDGIVRKVKTDPKDDTKPRQFVIWFADDEARTPLRVVADNKYGELRLNLEKYAHQPEPGCVVPAASAAKQ
jgi:hypothetical protein